VLSIDDRAWGVLLDFIRSETAIRKSERNEPSNPHSLPTPAPAPSPPSTEGNSTSPSVSVPPARPEDAPAEINFERIRAILCLKFSVASAGPKPLSPPYALVVIWPAPPAAHRVYEFLSFEEFRLDLRHMILQEMEGWSLWLAVVAFAFGLLVEGLRRIAT
jgi:hypothetical protein